MLKEKFEQDLKAALKNRDKIRISTLRMMLAEIHNKEIAEKGQLSDEQVFKILASSIKIHKEAAAAFETGGRSDLVEKEQQELAIIQSYLPQQMSDDELQGLVERVMRQVAAAGAADFGRVMKEAMRAVQGQADGTRVAGAVKAKLNK